MLISYAQNLEDVMLWRALKEVSSGFYIDVGAFSPEIDSVTKAFYDQGWRGINIEPNPECEEAFRLSRPRDINLRVAVADKPGRMTLNVFEGTGLSTLDASIAHDHATNGLGTHGDDVDVVTLTQVFEDHVPASQSVHFLKIDVEGFEAQVINGNDWSRNRPWILVVEATYPRTQIPSHEAWEPVLLEAGYLHVYSDGLSRFYVATEHAELVPRFAMPPNVFDDFKPAKQLQPEQQLAQLSIERNRLIDRVGDLEARVRQEQGRVSEAEEEVARMRNKVELLNAAGDALKSRLEAAEGQYRLLKDEMAAILQSTSWRVTYPLRRIVDSGAPLLSPLRAVARRLLAFLWSRAAASPHLKGAVLRLARRRPRVAMLLQQLQRRLSDRSQAAAATTDVFAAEPEALSAEARALLDLMLKDRNSPQGRN